METIDSSICIEGSNNNDGEILKMMFVSRVKIYRIEK